MHPEEAEQLLKKGDRERAVGELTFDQAGGFGDVDVERRLGVDTRPDLFGQF